MKNIKLKSFYFISHNIFKLNLNAFNKINHKSIVYINSFMAHKINNLFDCTTFNDVYS
jgi:hypothetical protein